MMTGVKTGDIIHHKAFGVGTVIEGRSNNGAWLVITIQFDDMGKKELLFEIAAKNMKPAKYGKDSKLIPWSES